ncbi:MAG: 2-C-methyl-D-erythritol 2,4-cyclodiphosphate synthase [Bacteroidetes bacterium CG23_combo_of_CG06-09_8_20_14_all_32_9]|nr:MAG: 2-C-methyl-D-erythritol 2,4-cyclodiphosphate synthase [Bacteroidetes bacterium CG23_combo_of_CG06-09_8_20_14_all_32_9]
MKLRIGQGFDVHRLESGLPLIIGGVTIPHSKGSVAHSDGDVLIHAICDALLGAANLGDIGTHFPDTSIEFKGIDSRILLAKTAKLIRKKGFEINNIDCTLCLEKPKIKPFIPKMKEEISKTAGISVNDISIKATTNEKLGYVGREEGVSAMTVALLYK